MKNKIMIFIFILSIAAAIVYLIAIPHAVAVQQVHTAAEHGTITTYPLNHHEMMVEAVKVILIVNIPNYFILLWKALHVTK